MTNGRILVNFIYEAVDQNVDILLVAVSPRSVLLKTPSWGGALRMSVTHESSVPESFFHVLVVSSLSIQDSFSCSFRVDEWLNMLEISAKLMKASRLMRISFSTVGSQTPFSSKYCSLHLRSSKGCENQALHVRS